jgi:hypoxanthine phosphoribosyltransferase
MDWQRLLPQNSKAENTRRPSSGATRGCEETMKHIYLTWYDTEDLVSKLIFKLNTPYDAILAISRGGIIPGGMLAEALKMKNVLTAAVLFPETTASSPRFMWPRFLQFPEDDLLVGRKILAIDNLWNRGRTLMAAKGRIEAAGGFPELAVLHWRPSSSEFPDHAPNYYAEVTEDFIHYPWQRIDDSDYRILAQPVMPLS